MKYLVLIGDIVDSRNLADRDAAQQIFKQACQQINRRRKALDIASPLMITLGDEFQGVLSGPQALWQVISNLELALFDTCQLRFSVGVGTITTELNSRSSLGMDGPAFYLAREGIETLRDSGSLYAVGGIGEGQQLAQHALDLWAANRRKWNYNRMYTFNRLLNKVPVPEIAAKLGVTEQAVYRTRRDGELDTVIGLLREISALIAREIQR